MIIYDRFNNALCVIKKHYKFFVVCWFMPKSVWLALLSSYFMDFWRFLTEANVLLKALSISALDLLACNPIDLSGFQFRINFWVPMNWIKKREPDLGNPSGTGVAPQRYEGLTVFYFCLSSDLMHLQLLLQWLVCCCAFVNTTCLTYAIKLITF